MKTAPLLLQSLGHICSRYQIDYSALRTALNVANVKPVAEIDGVAFYDARADLVAVAMLEPERGPAMRRLIEEETRLLEAGGG